MSDMLEKLEDDLFDPHQMFERPLPRDAAGTIIFFDCTLAGGPRKGKRIGELTRPDADAIMFWSG